MSFEHLRATVDGPIATVWLVRPPVNAVSQPVYKEIKRLFSDIDQLGPDIRAVVLGGEGKHFCGGNDLDEFETLGPENSPERMFHAREAFWAIRDCAVPVIGAVHGVALGSGVAIAASCDFVVASDDARFGLPEIKVGVMGGAKHLSRLMPQNFVRMMFLTAEPVPASALVRFGGVVDVVPRDELLDRAYALAAQIVRYSPAALRVAKKGLNEIEFRDVKSGYEHEQSLTTLMCGHPDAKEALRAFREQREPSYAPTAVSG